MLAYLETPIQRINSRFLEKAQVRLFVKREDLNHPFATGNKWWKLKYNLEEALRLRHTTVLTFGGAYSNLIYATAAAAFELGLKSIGIIRGEMQYPLNPILAFAQEKGMHLHYVSREGYGKKSEFRFIENLMKLFGEFYLIPEGGNNSLAVKGCAELGAQLKSTEFDCICLPVGTGGTMAGIVIGLNGLKRVLGFSVLKKGGFLVSEVRKHFFNFTAKEFSNWEIETNYDFGGYAKANVQLLDFINSFQAEQDVPLDRIYTGKMMFGIFDMIRQNKIQPGSNVLALHTGGIH